MCVEPQGQRSRLACRLSRSGRPPHCPNLRPHSPLKLVKALCYLDPSGPASRKCMRELRSVCSANGILPTSCTLVSRLLDIRPEPSASGGYGEVYEGTLDGSRVCIKRVKAYTNDPPEKALKVRCFCHRFSYLSQLTKAAGLLSRGCDVETADTSKRHAPPGCHHPATPATCFRLDVWW